MTDIDTQTATVIARFGHKAEIETNHNERLTCFIKKHIQDLVVGDQVTWETDPHNNHRITSYTERRNVLRRQGNHSKTLTLAANIDHVIITLNVASKLSLTAIDQYLAAAELSGIKPILCLNKIDLLDQDSMQEITAQLQLYQAIGYTVIHTSCINSTGLTALREQLKNSTSVFVGASGAGKSSLLQLLLPDEAIKVGEMSEGTQLGKHTTTTARMYQFPSGGRCIDSPGIREFSLWPMSAEQLILGFIEFKTYLGDCRFRNCHHRTEPGCAITAAVAKKQLAASRLDNYHTLAE